MSVTSTQALEFNSYLGTTLADNGALGQFNDLTFGRSYACISAGACAPESFVRNFDLGADSIVGIYLVRDGNGGGNVPEPTTLLLTSLGLLAAGTLRRRKPKA